MKNKILDKNNIELIGQLSERTTSFINYTNNCEYIETSIIVRRLSKTKLECDEFIINLPASLYYDVIDAAETITPIVKIKGEIRTYSIVENDVSHLKLLIFVKELRCTNEPDKCEVHFDGTICKLNNLRTTPSGKTICDFIIANNHSPYKTAYVPSIAWEKLAKEFAKQKVGTKVCTTGVLHQRHYLKWIDDVQYVKTTYEYSVDDCTFYNKETK